MERENMVVDGCVVIDCSILLCFVVFFVFFCVLVRFLVKEGEMVWWLSTVLGNKKERRAPGSFGKKTKTKVILPFFNNKE